MENIEDKRLAKERTFGMIKKCFCDVQSDNRPCIYCIAALHDTFNKHGKKVRSDG